MRRRPLRRAFVITVACSVGSACASGPRDHEAGLDPPRVESGTPGAEEPEATSVASSSAPVDADGDRVVDGNDRCPVEPEDLDGEEDADGCPEVDRPRVVIVTGNDNPPAPIVQFDGGSVQPTKESLPIIEHVAKTLREHPEILRIRVEGHDDPSSPRAAALKVSRARADSVVQILVNKHGIDEKRLRSLALGSYCPMGDSATPAGRQANRRVHFRLAETASGPAIREVGCEASRAAGIIDPDATPPKP